MPTLSHITTAVGEMPAAATTNEGLKSSKTAVAKAPNKSLQDQDSETPPTDTTGKPKRSKTSCLLK